MKIIFTIMAKMRGSRILCKENFSPLKKIYIYIIRSRIKSFLLF